MDKVIEKWDEILQIVKVEYDVANVAFNTWLKPLKVYEVRDNVVTILVPSEQSVLLDIVNKKYRLPLQVTICEVTGMESCEIQFILPENVPKKEIPSYNMSESKSLRDQRCEEAHLNPKYTFDSFIVGSNNKFAQAAALAVAESPGDTYNPLFIYGGAGLGKTHLMHSIAHYIIDNNENSKVLYVTSEEFTNELIETIRNGNNSAMSKFREKYRNIDVLLVDDIQFIIGKESTQEEFYIKSNIRELEGAFNKVMASSKLEKKEVTLELAEKALKDIISPDQQKVITPEYIISVVAEHYHVTTADLCGNKRSSKIVMPRQIAMYLCRDIIDTSLKTIGKNLGNRDHTTVMHGIEKIEKELQTNDNLKNSIDTLRKKINPQG